MLPAALVAVAAAAARRRRVLRGRSAGRPGVRRGWTPYSNAKRNGNRRLYTGREKTIREGGVVRAPPGKGGRRKGSRALATLCQRAMLSVPCRGCAPGAWPAACGVGSRLSCGNQGQHQGQRRYNVGSTTRGASFPLSGSRACPGCCSNRFTCHGLRLRHHTALGSSIRWICFREGKLS